MDHMDYKMRGGWAKIVARIQLFERKHVNSAPSTRRVTLPSHTLNIRTMKQERHQHHETNASVKLRIPSRAPLLKRTRLSPWHRAMLRASTLIQSGSTMPGAYSGSLKVEASRFNRQMVRHSAMLVERLNSEKTIGEISIIQKARFLRECQIRP